jgi:hypothetical protein
MASASYFRAIENKPINTKLYKIEDKNKSTN